MSYLSDKLLVTGYLMLLLSGTVNATDKAATTEASKDSDVAPLLDVYKSPSCGCCQKWIDHAEHAGFKITAHNTNSLGQIKAERGYCGNISLVTPAFLKTVLYLKAIYRRVLLNGF